MPDARATITVMYSCKTCPVTKAPVQVPARTEDEDVIAWTNQTIGRCGVDHRRRSPMCTATHLDLMVPMANRAMIGGPQVQ